MTSSLLSSETVKTLKMERDQYADDLQQVEKSFTELHKRYDKLRETTQNQRRTEEKLKTELKDLRKQLQDSAVNFNVSDKITVMWLWLIKHHKEARGTPDHGSGFQHVDCKNLKAEWMFTQLAEVSFN